MLKNHPKGLFVLALANMGERFGYYTMLAIFVLFMQAKFGFSSDATATIFGVFLAAVYFLPLFGGLLADKVLGYGKTIMLGIVIMFAGYLLLAIPSGTDNLAKVTMFGALLLIAMGTGCFKGNLQALVGNLYDDPRYSAKRDLAFSIFYMCINIGAFFAPSAAEGVSNYFMQKDDFTYNPSVPSFYHQFNNKEIQPDGYVNLAAIAKAQGRDIIDVSSFASLNSIVTDSLTPTVASVFGSTLTAADANTVDEEFSEIIKTKYASVTGENVNVASIKAGVLSSLPAVNSESAMESALASLDTEGYSLIGSKKGEKYKAPVFYSTDDSNVKKAVKVLDKAVAVQMTKAVDDKKLAQFGEEYTFSLSNSYNYGFGVACISLVISILIFIGFRRLYKDADKTEKQKAAEAKAAGTAQAAELTPEQTKERLVALGLVFTVVIFFWMSFHQNGLTMTWFARDYTQSNVEGFGRFGFSLLTLLPFVVAYYGVLNLIQAKTSKGKTTGAIVAAVGAALAFWAYTNLPETFKISPQIFQQFNPYFIVLLTPLTVGLFSWLAKRGKEPLAPRKIGIGMLIASLAFVLLAVGSFGLPVPSSLESTGGISPTLVSPNWLISTYFILTVAELFLSPMGLSFVSKVAPPKYKGMAQGGWLAATAIGNYLVAIIGYLWGDMELWVLWAILVGCCLLSAAFLFSVMKRLEKTTSEA